MLADDAAALKSEYTLLKNDDLPLPVATFQCNMKLNRYNNVPCFDETRVVLNDGLDGDYIHASRVDGYKMKDGFILTPVSLLWLLFSASWILPASALIRRRSVRRYANIGGWFGKNGFKFASA